SVDRLDRVHAFLHDDFVDGSAVGVRGHRLALCGARAPHLPRLVHRRDSDAAGAGIRLDDGERALVDAMLAVARARLAQDAVDAGGDPVEPDAAAEIDLAALDEVR